LSQYMVGELRRQLRGVGKLDVLAGVGAKVDAYYRRISAVDDGGSGNAALARRASALELLAEVEGDKHDPPAAARFRGEARARRESAAAAAPAAPAQQIARANVRLLAGDAPGAAALARVQRGVEIARAQAAKAPASREARLLLARAER